MDKIKGFYKSKFVYILSAVLICSVFASCSASTSEEADEQNASTNETTQSKQATQESTETQVTAQDSDEYALSVEDALQVLENFYGDEYTVTANGADGGIQYFAVNSADVEYAEVEVDLYTGSATETIIETGETGEYNLLV